VATADRYANGHRPVGDANNRLSRLGVLKSKARAVPGLD